MSGIRPAGEFKAKCLEAMDEVASTGEPIIVTKRGRPVAQIVPITQRPKSLRGFLRGSTEYARLSRPSTTSRLARSPSSDPRTRAVGALAAVALMVGVAFGSPGEALARARCRVHQIVRTYLDARVSEAIHLTHPPNAYRWP